MVRFGGLPVSRRDTAVLPDSFGMTNHVGFVFAHNVFTVQFLYDRLPLYIVALYPALATLAFEIVRVMGVFGTPGDPGGRGMCRIRASLLL